MLLKELELLDVSTNPKHSGQSGSCDRWNSTSLWKINNFYKSDPFFVDKTSETIILQPFGFCEENSIAHTKDNFLLHFNS